MKKILAFTLLICSLWTNAQELAILQYKGGGDWYGNPTALPNLIEYCNSEIHTKISKKPVNVTPDSPAIFTYPYLFITGHGNIYFSDFEAENLRNYMLSGGFIHVDDNYGIDTYIRRELKKIFPTKNLQELPVNHPIFNSAFKFPKGLPKIHEHDGKRPQAFGIIVDNRLLFLYTYETDLSDGWEDAAVHNDPPEIREKALKMGANIIKYVFEN